MGMIIAIGGKNETLWLETLLEWKEYLLNVPFWQFFTMNVVAIIYGDWSIGKTMGHFNKLDIDWFHNRILITIRPHE